MDKITQKEMMMFQQTYIKFLAKVLEIVNKINEIEEREINKKIQYLDSMEIMGDSIECLYTRFDNWNDEVIESYTIPVSYIYDEDWQTQHKINIEEEKHKKKLIKEKQDAIILEKERQKILIKVKEEEVKSEKKIQQDLKLLRELKLKYEQ